MINRPSHLVTLPNAAVGFLQFAEIPMMARGSRADGAELRKGGMLSIPLIQINGAHQRQIYGWFIAAIVEIFSVLACRIANRLPKPPRFITAANSDRWMTAMLMPSTMISMIR